MSATSPFWTGRHVMYRVYDEGARLIYIGATNNLAVRWDAHSATSWWYSLARKVRVQVFPTREAAFIAESIAIQEEEPAFNIRVSGRNRSDWSHLTASDVELAFQGSPVTIRFHLDRSTPTSAA